ncbi:MAG: hypothetical protein AMXMBFR13_21110 [Phycisphaerae bacterium]
MIVRTPSLLLVTVVIAALLAPPATAQESQAPGVSAVISWRFGGDGQWSGWTPNAGIREINFDAASISFQAGSGDPQITSPLFELPRATNRQWIAVDIDCDGPGTGELFYTNKTTGQYGGLEPAWMCNFTVPSIGRQIIQVWPFWEGMGRIIRLRFDPPAGVHCRLYAIHIMESTIAAPAPAWDFVKAESAAKADGASGAASALSWQSFHAAHLERTSAGLLVRPLRPQAMIITPVEPFDAAKRSLLRIDVSEAPDRVIGFYWVAREHPGLMGEPIDVNFGHLGPQTLDLRQFPMWQGTITHLALGFASEEQAGALRLRSVAIEPNDPARSYLRMRYLGFERPINRPGRRATVMAVVEHGGGPASPGGEARLESGGRLLCDRPTVGFAGVAAGQQQTLRWQVMPREAQPAEIRVGLNGQLFVEQVRIDPAVSVEGSGGYAVPPPRPVKTKHQLGIYYFPGWSPEDISRWQKQQGFPEREPVLGWYEEGLPEVADWHIKWAVENGLSYFVYDWYWRDGKEVLAAGLNEGFLKARYNGLMKFAVMWANHRPFADHTPEQLLEVTDYWIERYFRKPNYLTYDGQPYVSFFSPGDLIGCLGSEEKTSSVLAAMRARVKAAGLPGLHIAACSGPDRPAAEALKQAGFDSLTAYNYLRTGSPVAHCSYRQFLFGHAAIWESMQQAKTLPYIPLLTVGWDARPWHGPRTQRKFARNTEDFRAALQLLKSNLDKTGGTMGLLEAWNEWGEGSYIEPNTEFGFGDLEAIREVFAEPGDWPVNIGPEDLGQGGKYDQRPEDQRPR